MSPRLLSSCLHRNSRGSRLLRILPTACAELLGILGRLHRRALYLNSVSEVQGCVLRQGPSPFLPNTQDGGSRESTPFHKTRAVYPCHVLSCSAAGFNGSRLWFYPESLTIQAAFPSTPCGSRMNVFAAPLAVILQHRRLSGVEPMRLGHPRPSRIRKLPCCAASCFAPGSSVTYNPGIPIPHAGRVIAMNEFRTVAGASAACGAP